MAYLEILIATVVSFFVGFLWYTALFGKKWQAESGITDEQAKEGIAMTHGLAFLMMGVIAWAVSQGAGYHDMEEQTFLHGAFHGGRNGLLYALPAIAIGYLYQKKSLALFLIDGLYMLAVFAISGGMTYMLKLA